MLMTRRTTKMRLLLALPLSTLLQGIATLRGLLPRCMAVLPATARLLGRRLLCCTVLLMWLVLRTLWVLWLLWWRLLRVLLVRHALPHRLLPLLPLLVVSRRLLQLVRVL